MKRLNKKYNFDINMKEHITNKMHLIFIPLRFIKTGDFAVRNTIWIYANDFADLAYGTRLVRLEQSHL